MWMNFVLITAGDRRGQIFDTDSEGAYYFLADTFNKFYLRWLDIISNEDEFKKNLNPTENDLTDELDSKLFQWILPQIGVLLVPVLCAVLSISITCSSS